MNLLILINFILISLSKDVLTKNELENNIQIKNHLKSKEIFKTKIIFKRSVNNVYDEDSMRNLVKSMNIFSMKLFKYMAKKPRYSNLFISPISLYSSLISLLSASGGVTESQLKTLLALNGVNENQISNGYLSMMNSLEKGLGETNYFKLFNYMLVDKSINMSSNFTKTVTKFYNMSIERVSFDTESMQIYEFINNVIHWATYGNIVQIMDEKPDPLSKLLILNGVYFKGIWAKSFNPKETILSHFKNKDSTISKIKLMRMKNEFDYYCENDRNKKIEPAICSIKIPYSDYQLTFQIIINANPKSSIDNVINQKLTENYLQNLDSKMNPRMIELGVPVFSMKDSHELREPMDFLGANSVFTKDKADLSKFLVKSKTTSQDPNLDLFVNQFKHKTSIQVNEEGSVASAATSVLIGNRNGLTKFYADRPFIFLIRDNISGAILFIGRVHNLPTLN